MPGANPQSAEPIRKIASPPNRTGLRPNVSLSVPATGIVTTCAMTNACTSHGYSSSPPRSDTICGIAGLTTLCSSADRNIPSIAPMMISRLVLRGRSIPSGRCSSGDASDGRTWGIGDGWLRRHG